MKKEYFIKKASDFNLIINTGNKIKGDIFTLYYIPSEDNRKYFGIAVGKKHGNAVERNKIKRKIRIILHENEKLFQNKYKYIIMIRKDCLLIKHESWVNDLVNIIRKVNNNEEN